MTGLSGAVVVVNKDGTVTKRGGSPGRTREQGEWIITHGSEIFPSIVQTTHDGYIMEKLKHVNYWDVSPYFIHSSLKNYVWSQPAVTPPTVNTQQLLLEKVEVIINKSLKNIVSNATKKRIIAEANKAATGAYNFGPELTHGDPTAENVMNRAGYGNVLIDPIKSSEAVPDSPVIDVGKMLQSAYGWESAKHRTGVVAYKPADVADALNDDELFEIGQSWAVVHIVRAVPYIIKNLPESLSNVIDVLETVIERP